MIRTLWAALLLSALWGVSTVAAWETEVVDGGGVGGYSSIEVGSSDRIHISYFAGTLGHLKYAVFEDSEWRVETVDDQFLTGHHTSLELDSLGSPRIAYRYYSGSAIRYAVWNGAEWTFSDFETDPEKETDISMALDDADLPHISYYDGYFQGEPHDLRHAHFDGTSWSTVLLDSSGEVGRGSSIALDSSGHPHISYYDETNADLKYATFNGQQWSVVTLDDVEFIAFNFRTAIAVDGQDGVHVVYSAYHNDGPDWYGRLKYAHNDGGGWEISVIEEALPTRDFRIPAITIDPGDSPHVSYLLYYNVEPITPDLNARYDGATWQTEFVDAGPIHDSDFSNSIDLDSAGRVHVSYASNGVLLMHAVSDIPASVDLVGGSSPPPLGLGPPHPNPSQGAWSICFELPCAGDVIFDVFDALGRRVGAVAGGWFEPGRHTIEVNRELPRGLCLVRLRQGDRMASRKLVVR